MVLGVVFLLLVRVVVVVFRCSRSFGGLFCSLLFVFCVVFVCLHHYVSIIGGYVESFSPYLWFCCQLPVFLVCCGWFTGRIVGCRRYRSVEICWFPGCCFCAFASVLLGAAFVGFLVLWCVCRWVGVVLSFCVTGVPTMGCFCVVLFGSGDLFLFWKLLERV